MLAYDFMMHTLSIVLAVALLTVQGLGELMAMWRTGSLRRKWTPEWTFRAVNLPYRLMFAVGMLDNFLATSNPTLPLLTIGAAVATSGVAVRIACHYQLGYHFSPYVELDDGHQLIESGFYRYVRHPMYLGTLLTLLGAPLMMGSVWAVVFAVAALAGLIARIKKEELFLREHLAGYDQYAMRTWRLAPWVW